MNWVSHFTRERTLFRRTLLFFLATLFLLILIYPAVFFGGGLLEETEKNAFSILRERTNNRKLDLENEMVGRWSNVTEGKSALMDKVAEVLGEQRAGARTLKSNPNLCQEVLRRSAPDLVAMLRRNGVTGVFAILDCPDREGNYPGIYLRDYDPKNYVAGNADLLLERGLPKVARELNIPMDSFWSAFFRFSPKNEDTHSFYFHPMEAVKNADPADRQENFFYHWSPSFSLVPEDREVVAYTVPLVAEDGTVLGVIGVDLTVDYLAERLSLGAPGGDGAGTYFLGLSMDGGQSYQTICTSGAMFKAYFGQAETLTVLPDRRTGFVTLPGGNQYRGKTIYGAVQPLKLYNSNTPFEEEKWALIGIESGERLLKFSGQVHTILLYTTAFSLAVGLAFVFFAARSFTAPISELVGNLRQSDPNKPIRLRRVNVAEVDALSGSIEALSDAAAEAASRTSQIISMSNIPIGVFEYREWEGTVFCGKNLFKLLNWPEHPEEDFFLPKEEFLLRLRALTGTWGVIPEGEGEQVFLIAGGERERWVQLFRRAEGKKTLGVFLDVTADVETKKRIEYERDYDVLTGLYNRRAFDRKVEELFADPLVHLRTAAIVMLDLDNLKYINDSAGHDYGDVYLQAFARELGFFRDQNAVVGRRSGDEFNVFLYGFDGAEDIRALLARFWENLSTATSALPKGDEIRLRVSGGMAWYGRDAASYVELLRLADFAMYRVKHTVKGALREFDRTDYDQRAILIRGQDALNRMLENRMVRYALQPIVSACDGAVYGYEFLMRPLMKQLVNLTDLFRLARAQSKLGQIEEMTWSEAMSRFAFLVRSELLPAGARAFINSVSNQPIPEGICRQLETLYGDVLGRVVVEITESEEPSRGLSREKKRWIKSHGGLLALDDYGAGYNTDAVLVDIVPDIVKVDVDMVRGVNRDSDRLALISNLISYAKGRGILVLAEGVESAEEMETLISCGVDLLQGYYLARPDFSPPVVADEVVEQIRGLHARYFPSQH